MEWPGSGWPTVAASYCSEPIQLSAGIMNLNTVAVRIAIGYSTQKHYRLLGTDYSAVM